MTTHTTRSIFSPEVTLEELQQVKTTNELMPGMTLAGIEERTDFDKLFRHRLNPRFIADALLKERQAGMLRRGKVRGGSYESEEVKRERLDLARQALKMKEERYTSQTQMQSQMFKRLQAIDDVLQLILRQQVKLGEIVDRLASAQRVSP